MKRGVGMAVHNTAASSRSFHLTELVTAALMCSSVILTLCPSPHSRRPLQRGTEVRFDGGCGDEFRIETQDGTTFQGRLLSNDGSLLVMRHGASGLGTIALGDVTSVLRVKRATGTGFLIGSIVGAGVGCVAAAVWYESEKPRHVDRPFGYVWAPVGEIVAIIVSATVVGGVVGGIIGHSSQRLGPVQLEALPMCLSPFGDITPIKLSLTVDF